MATLRIEVTAEDIREGAIRDYRRCPVALAFRRAAGPAFPSLSHVAAGSSWLMVCAGLELLAEARLPEAARDFIAAFDRREPVAPFAFGLEIPEAA